MTNIENKAIITPTSLKQFLNCLFYKNHRQQTDILVTKLTSEV